jgi:hypothetical protein
MTVSPRTARVYLDVDGTISAAAFEPPRARTGWTGEWSTVTVDRQRVQFSHELVAALNDLTASVPEMTAVWSSNWEQSAADLLSPVVGLNGSSWPVLTGAGEDGISSWWKLDAIRDDIAAHRPAKMVWLDDGFNYEPSARAWAAGLKNSHPDMQVLVISPDPLHGLTRAHVARVREFLAA